MSIYINGIGKQKLEKRLELLDSSRKRLGRTRWMA